MAFLSPFQRGLSLNAAAWEPLLSSPASSLLLGLINRLVLCLCSVVLEGRTGSSDFYSVNTLFKDILFYWRLCGP